MPLTLAKQLSEMKKKKKIIGKRFGRTSKIAAAMVPSISSLKYICPCLIIICSIVEYCQRCKIWKYKTVAHTHTLDEIIFDKITGNANDNKACIYA